MALEFMFSEFINELELFKTICSKFVEESTSGVLDQFIRDLKIISISQTDGKHQEWSISRNRPLRTRSAAAYESNSGKCKHTVYGEISSIWEITPQKMPKAGSSQRRFSLTGLASTRLTIKEDDTELARWRMEIASDDGPGSYFHAQIMGEKQDQIFPHSLPVPRLPIFLATPMLTIEFLLGELFQEEWAKHISRSGGTTQFWSSLQESRMQKFLDWQKSVLRSNSNVSPLHRLKIAKPPENLFL